MISYFMRFYGKLFALLLEHMQLVAISVGIALLIAIPVALLIIRSKLLSTITLAAFGIIYSIPSMALFALLIPLTGLGKTTAIIVLVSYNQYILVRNILAAFSAIDKAILEAARGMGLSKLQLLHKIQFPLALPILLGGVRISVVSTIGIATIAAVINAGGLGVVLFEGLQTMYYPKIIWGTIMAALLAFAANQILMYLEKRASMKARGDIKQKVVI